MALRGGIQAHCGLALYGLATDSVNVFSFLFYPKKNFTPSLAPYFLFVSH